jgi:hypothetical protein
MQRHRQAEKRKQVHKADPGGDPRAVYYGRRSEERQILLRFLYSVLLLLNNVRPRAVPHPRRRNLQNQRPGTIIVTPRGSSTSTNLVWVGVRPHTLPLARLRSPSSPPHVEHPVYVLDTISRCQTQSGSDHAPTVLPPDSRAYAPPESV